MSNLNRGCICYVRWEKDSRKECLFAAVSSAHRRIRAAREIARDAEQTMSGLFVATFLCAYLPKNVQQIIMTVASEPRFEGDRNPRSANTEMKINVSVLFLVAVVICALTEGDSDHGT